MLDLPTPPAFAEEALEVLVESRVPALPTTAATSRSVAASMPDSAAAKSKV